MNVQQVLTEFQRQREKQLKTISYSTAREVDNAIKVAPFGYEITVQLLLRCKPCLRHHNLLI